MLNRKLIFRSLLLMTAVPSEKQMRECYVSKYTLQNTPTLYYLYTYFGTPLSEPRIRGNIYITRCKVRDGSEVLISEDP